MCVIVSLCCTAETDTTLYSKRKKKKKGERAIRGNRNQVDPHTYRHKSVSSDHSSIPVMKVSGENEPQEPEKNNSM